MTLTAAGCLLFCSFLISVFTAFEVMSAENHIWFTTALTDTMEYKALFSSAHNPGPFPRRARCRKSVEVVLLVMLLGKGEDLP